MKLINWNKGKSWTYNPINEIEYICSIEQPDIFAIHEYNLRKSDDIDQVQIQGYELILDTMINKYGMSRTAMYIKSEIKYQRRKEYEIEEAIVAVTVQPYRSKPVNIISYYRQWQIWDSDKTIPGSETDSAQKSRMDSIAKKCQK